MTSLIEKARLGRMNALAVMSDRRDVSDQLRPVIGLSGVSFISTRARLEAEAIAA
jgi:hypothetical protein